MARPFIGKLHDDESFKKFWMIHDSMLPLEWRINCIPEDNRCCSEKFSKYFDRLVVKELHGGTVSFWRENASKYYSSIRVVEKWNMQFGMFRDYTWKGIDELILPVEILENDHSVLDGIQSINADIRRVDIVLPTYDYDVQVDIDEFETWCDENGVELNVITKDDPPEVDEWYSKPGEETQVDPLPEPYIEDDKSYSVTGDALIYWEGKGFFLNQQNTSRAFLETQEPFAKSFNPEEFPVLMLKAKVELYTQFRDEIQNRKDNIYWMYFNWVADNVVINSEYNFIPEYVLPPYSKYYQVLIDNGWVQTQYGLVKPDSGSITSIIGMKEHEKSEPTTV